MAFQSNELSEFFFSPSLFLGGNMVIFLGFVPALLV
jgi:hypothetical protein